MIGVRVALSEDINNISCVLAASWRTAYRGIVADDYLDALSDDHWVKFLTSGLTSGSVFSLVLHDSQEIIGATVMGKSEAQGEVHLFALYLLPDKIGQGLGHAFYCDIENEMKQRGYTKCTLDVLENNTRAIRFYEVHGYVEASKGTTAELGGQSYKCKSFEKALA